MATKQAVAKAVKKWRGDKRSLTVFFDKEKGISRAKVIKGAGINVTYGYQIMSGERHPSRDYVIQLALGLGCDLRETQRLLRLAGKSELWVKVPRDAIIAYCIEHGMTRVECDDELYRLGEETLLDAEE